MEFVANAKKGLFKLVFSAFRRRSKFPAVTFITLKENVKCAKMALICLKKSAYSPKRFKNIC